MCFSCVLKNLFKLETQLFILLECIRLTLLMLSVVPTICLCLFHSIFLFLAADTEELFCLPAQLFLLSQWQQLALSPHSRALLSYRLQMHFLKGDFSSEDCPAQKQQGRMDGKVTMGGQVNLT